MCDTPSESVTMSVVRRALSVDLGVQRSFREQDGMFLGRNPELVVETVVPDFLACHSNW